jgi:hypothetical protein
VPVLIDLDPGKGLCRVQDRMHVDALDVAF